MYTIWSPIPDGDDLGKKDIGSNDPGERQINGTWYRKVLDNATEDQLKMVLKDAITDGQSFIVEQNGTIFVFELTVI